MVVVSLSFNVNATENYLQYMGRNERAVYNKAWDELNNKQKKEMTDGYVATIYALALNHIANTEVGMAKIKKLAEAANKKWENKEKMGMKIFTSFKNKYKNTMGIEEPRFDPLYWMLIMNSSPVLAWDYMSAKNKRLAIKHVFESFEDAAN